MTAQDLDVLHVRYGQVLEQLGATGRKLDDVAAATNDATRAVWAAESRMSALTARHEAHDRRLGLVESWQADKDDEVTATGRHRVGALEDHIRRIEDQQSERRRHYTRYAIATAVGLATTGLLTWVGVALAGCG